MDSSELHEQDAWDRRMERERVEREKRAAEAAELTGLRATIARIREICAVEYDAAYDLRADILAELVEP